MTVPADIEVVDADNARRSIHAPLAPGRAVATESRPVVLSTEDLAVLSSIDTRLTTLAGYVDGLETLITSSNMLSTSLNGYVDGIEALIGTTNTSLSNISGYVDGLETLNTSLNGYVDGLETLNGAINETAPASDTASSGLNGRLQRIAQRLTALLGAGAATIAKAEDVASADADVGVPAMAVRKATPANTSGSDGDYEMLQMSAGRLWVDPSGVTVTTKETRSTTGTQSSVAGSASDVTILASNANRLGASVENDSTAILYLLLANATSSSTNRTVKVPPDGYYEVPFNYTGVIKGLWASATGSVRVTEFT